MRSRSCVGAEWDPRAWSPARRRGTWRASRTDLPSPTVWSAGQGFQPVGQRCDLDPFLFGGVALADRYRLVGQGVEVDRYAERGADLVLAAVAAADVPARLVVLHPELASQ